MVIATGHISVKESLHLMDCANQMDFRPVIFNHPDSHSIGGTFEDMALMASKGAFIEFCCLGMMPAFQRIHPSDLVPMIKKLGVEHCILSTDFFFEWAPPPPEMLRMVMGAMAAVGMSREDLRTLVKHNPEKIMR